MEICHGQRNINSKKAQERESILVLVVFGNLEENEFAFSEKEILCG